MHAKKSKKLKAVVETEQIMVREEIEGVFQKVFQYLDEDGDGKISTLELCNFSKMAGEVVDEEDVEVVMESCDFLNWDGLLDYDDFVKFVGTEEEEERIKSLQTAFNMYEDEEVGGITTKSLRRMLQKLGEKKTPEQCDAMIRRYDLNGDGVINFEEFKIMMLL